MTQNPVINRFGRASGGNTRPLSATELQGMYDQPAYAGPRQGTGFMTLDDVVQRTAAMLITVLAAGAVAWVALPDRLFVPALVISAMGGLGLGLYMSFTMRVNAVTALLYSALEGVLLGAISHVFEQRWPGIVVQAVAGTVDGRRRHAVRLQDRRHPRDAEVHPGDRRRHHRRLRPDDRQPGRLPVHAERAGPALRRPARDRLQPRLHRPSPRSTWCSTSTWSSRASGGARRRSSPGTPRSG